MWPLSEGGTPLAIKSLQSEKKGQGAQGGVYREDPSFVRPCQVSLLRRPTLAFGGLSSNSKPQAFSPFGKKLH